MTVEFRQTASSTPLINRLKFPAIATLILASTSFEASAAFSFSLQNPSSGTITITISGGRSYTEIHQINPGDVKIAQFAPNGTYTITGKAPGYYSYYVLDCYAGQGGYSCAMPPAQTVQVASAPPPSPSPPTIPAPPSPVIAKVARSTILISLDSISAATFYQVRRNGSQVAQPSASSFVDTSVINGQSYTYTVNSCNAAGCSAFTASPAVTAGNVQVGSSANERYEYDALGRLKKFIANQKTKTDYKYDKAGNRTEVTE